MSIVDHFDRTLEPGFLHSIEPRAAKRQFNISLGLVVILLIGTAGLALTMGIVPLNTNVASLQGKAYVQAPQLIHVQNASAGQVTGG